MDSIRYEFESGTYRFFTEGISEEPSEYYSEEISEEISEVSSEESSEVSSEESSEVSSEVISDTVVYTSTVDLSTIETELHEIKQGVGYISLFSVMFFFVVVVYLVQNWLSHYF